MNIDWNLYKTFYVVAKYNSMTKAAEELMVSQPAISKAIKTLEDQIGSVLFNRSKRGITLSEEGKMLYKRIEPAICLIQNAENGFDEYKKLNVGEIKIGISSVLSKCLMTDVLYQFSIKYPNVRISIVNGLANDLIEKLNLGKLDFVIFNEAHNDERLVDIEKLTSLDYCFVYNPRYFNIKAITIKDMKEYPLILQPKSSNTRKFLERHFTETFNPKMEVVSQSLICDFVRRGLGVGYVFEKLVDEDLEKIKFGISMTTDILIAKNKSIDLSVAAKTFIKELKNSLK